MATGEWLSRNRSHSADIELDSPESCSSRSTSSSPSRQSYVARSSLPSFTVTPPISPTRVAGGRRSPHSSTFHESIMINDSTLISNLSAKYGSLDRRGVASTADNATTVKVYLNLSQYKIGTPNNPCSLQALGIVPKRHSMSDRSPFATLRPNRLKSILPISVRGVVPSSPVALTGQLHTGDQIVTVNGQMVNLKNIDSVLSSVTSEIIMDVIHYTRDVPPDHPFSPPPVLPSDYEQTPPPVQMTTPPLVLLLTLDTKEDDPPEKDILYRYPFNDGGDPLLMKLINLRGVVATLCDVTSNHFQSPDTSCCSFFLDNQLFFAFGKKFGIEIFLMAMPAIRTPSTRLYPIYQTIYDSFVGLFGSIRDGLVSHDYDSTHLLSSIFHSMCPDPASDSGSTCIQCYSGPVSSLLTPTKLQIPTKTRALFSAQLNQLDSGSLRSQPHSDASPNPIPIGSCVFYKGYLVMSHLAPPLLQSVMAVCLINDLFELTINKTAAQTIVWRRIYQTTPTNYIPGYHTYVAVMAMEQTIIGHVIDYLPDTDSAPPTISQSLRLIMEQLHTNGLLSECEGCVLSQTPILTTADVLLASLVTSSNSIKKTHMKRNSAGSLRSLSIVTNNSSSVGTGSESDSNSDDSGTGMSRFYSPQKKKSSFKNMLATSFRKSKSAQNFRDRQASLISLIRPPYMLVAGTENLLLYFTALDEGGGVVICPCKEQLGLQPVQRDLLKSFNNVATSIHRILHKKYKPIEKPASFDDDDDEDQCEGSEDDGKGSGPFTTPGSSVREYGILMECTIPSSVTFTSPKLLYWVIGRLFVEEGIELYVCFQENMSQVTVEMLFKLIFGTA